MESANESARRGVKPEEDLLEALVATGKPRCARAELVNDPAPGIVRQLL